MTAQAVGDRFVVRPHADQGRVLLTKGGSHVGWLRVDIRCTLDRFQEFLAVERSTFEVNAMADRRPLFRLDYLRNPNRAPAAHWNIHADRATVAELRGTSEAEVDVSMLHFPVGGARMRPCLEDVLQFLIHEFRVDRLPTAKQAIKVGRERWRRRQAGAVVRDTPDEACRVLRALGYTVVEPEDGARPANTKALQSW